MIYVYTPVKVHPLKITGHSVVTVTLFLFTVISCMFHTCHTSCLLVYVVLSHHCFLSMFMYMPTISASSLLSNCMINVVIIKSRCHILLLNLVIHSCGLLRVIAAHSRSAGTVQSCTYLLLCTLASLRQL